MRIFLRLFFLAAAWAVGGGGLVPCATAFPVRSLPTRSLSGALVQIGGIEYLSTTEFARRYGLRETWLVPEKKLTLTKAGVQLDLETEAREASLNGMRLFMGDAPKIYRQTLYLSRTDAERFVGPMIDPGIGFHARPPVRVIALDAGHGGKDKGKINDRLGVNEKTFTLDVVLRLRKLLETGGFKVVLTRADDHFVELEDRPAIASRAHADVFVSIHFNSVETGASRVTGLEVFSLTPASQYSTDDAMHEASETSRVVCPGNSYDNWSARLAFEEHRELLADLKMPDRGQKRQRFKVLRLANCPAILIEAGYLSNDTEARKISTSAYRQALAETIARGLKNYATTVETTKR